VAITYEEIKRRQFFREILVTVEFSEDKTFVAKKQFGFVSQDQLDQQLVGRCEKVIANINAERLAGPEPVMTFERDDVESLLKEKGILEENEKYEDLATKTITLEGAK